MTELAAFPVDDVTLTAVEHAMGGRLTYTPEGELVRIGADYSMDTLLDFLSGYDPAKLVPLDDGISEYVGGSLYHRDNIIRSLIAEVRRLRAEQ